MSWPFARIRTVLATRCSATECVPDSASLHESTLTKLGGDTLADGMQPLVSVIVPVRDDGERLRVALEHLAAQTLPREHFEVIVGDDGSRVSPPAIRSDDGWISVVRNPQRTSYAARNAAAESARGAVLAFCDSDCLPAQDWLEQGLAALETADVVAGEVVFVAPGEATSWSLLTADMFLDQRRNVVVGRAVTANLFVRRSVFEALGGFDPVLPSGGDYDFVRRALRDLDVRLRYAPAAIVRHPTIDTRAAFLRKVWLTNYWSAVRKVRDGHRPDLRGALMALLPPVGVAYARRNASRPPFRLARDRLNAAGLAPARTRQLRALLCLYFAVSSVAAAARISGWLRARRALRGAPDQANALVAARDAG
jgi:glycosyltransferase involved in cell wall biosynthesis